MARVAPLTRLSVIVPTLDEEAHLGRTLEGLVRPDVEVIVVDGGSADATVDVAARLGARVLHAPRGRARQLNAGASAARGEVLLFLHADTRLPDDFDAVVAEALKPGVVGGAFRFALDASGVSLRLVEAVVALRCLLFALPYGDQAIFVRADAFRRVGGFPDVPIMEDFELVRRLHEAGRFVVLAHRAETSARSWRRRGVVWVTLVNQATLLGWRAGVSPERLAAARRRALSGR